jgi:16S rRNA (cytosine967-C5)-methyltransferase
MLAALAVAPEPGERVVDLAAAPGGKTTHLAELGHDRLQVVAVDRHPARTRLVLSNTTRLGLQSVQAVVADAARAPLARGWADAVLLDAPCSDLGVVARRPDVRYRRREEDLAQLAALQRELLAGAAELVRPGGRLVYSVCSLEPEETVQQVQWLLQQRPDLELEAPAAQPPSALASDEGTCGPQKPQEDDPWPWCGEGLLWILPHRHGTDGFFVARFRRRLPG